MEHRIDFITSMRCAAKCSRFKSVKLFTIHLYCAYRTRVTVEEFNFCSILQTKRLEDKELIHTRANNMLCLFGCALICSMMKHSSKHKPTHKILLNVCMAYGGSRNRDRGRDWSHVLWLTKRAKCTVYMYTDIVRTNWSTRHTATKTYNVIVRANTQIWQRALELNGITTHKAADILAREHWTI